MKERTIGASLDRYKVVRRDWFAYNPMRLNIGSLARWQGSGEALVSPDYVVFHCDPGRLDPDFLDHFRGSRFWEQYVESAGNGSVRVRIYFNDLARMTIKLPPLDEQHRIAAVLNTANREIGLLQRFLDVLGKQKTVLTQQLLTGRLRVKEATP
jgi:type I restriction enzyme S subunit